MKKIKWAVILVAALAIMFAGCTGPFDADKYVGNPVGAGLPYIKVTGRTANYFGIDIVAPQTSEVVVTVSGAAGIKIGSQNEPWGTVYDTSDADDGPDGSKVFTIEANKVGNTGNLRIQANEGADFNIYEIEIGAFKLTTALVTAGFPKGYNITQEEIEDSGQFKVAGTPKLTIGR